MMPRPNYIFSHEKVNNLLDRVVFAAENRAVFCLNYRNRVSPSHKKRTEPPATDANGSELATMPLPRAYLLPRRPLARTLLRRGRFL